MLLPPRNFRDLGDLVSPRGPAIKKGLVFRSGSLDRLTRAEWRLLDSLGPRTVLDLRSPTEARRRPRQLRPVTRLFPLEFDEPVRRAVMPILFRREVRPRLIAIYEAAYEGLMASLGPHLRSMADILLNPASYPVIIHCQAGKDRTGVTVALLLLALGFDQTTVTDDYLRSNAFFPLGIEPKLRALRILSAGLLPVDNLRLIASCRESYLASTLQAIRRHHGSVEGFFHHHGVQTDDLIALRARLLQGE